LLAVAVVDKIPVTVVVVVVLADLELAQEHLAVVGQLKQLYLCHLEQCTLLLLVLVEVQLQQVVVHPFLEQVLLRLHLLEAVQIVHLALAVRVVVVVGLMVLEPLEPLGKDTLVAVAVETLLVVAQAVVVAQEALDLHQLHHKILVVTVDLVLLQQSLDHL
jgi:hypothetical protein